MKNAIWIGRRQVKGLIVLLALLPLIPTSFLIHTMWLKMANEHVRVVDEMNTAFRTQLRLAVERYSTEPREQSRSGKQLVQFLTHVFGSDLPMTVISKQGLVIYQSKTPMSGSEFDYRIVNGEFAGWNILIDSVTEIPQHIMEEEKATLKQAVIALVSTILIAGGVWLIVNRGLKTDEIRKDLITTISHEIKTPVAAIKILTESLESGTLEPTVQSEYLRLIARENERIEHLADRFLTYGRLEKGQLPIERKETALTRVIEDIAGMLAPRFNSVQGEISITGEKGVTVQGDHNGLSILFTNLLENALKYGGTPPRVRIDVAKAGGNALITVMDNGRGIPEAEHKAVFRRFYRSEGRLDDGQTGVGLGLAICRRITRLMKGSLSLAASGDREYPGAEFQIRLPLSSGAKV
ncbi:MAG: HAMP domain-containing sensor histidine kinase [Verrucomicrobiales bacterium]|nr:HAMP domain-containing sensor histidine kinase [Verrucomicrobiales bacterium]